jgi:hypothetical protein
MSSGSGSIESAASPTTSGRLERLEQMTGAPHAIASNGFKPKPSYSETNANACAAR